MVRVSESNWDSEAWPPVTPTPGKPSYPMPDSLKNLLNQNPITEEYSNLTKAIDAAYSKPQMDAIETSVRYHLANRPSLPDFRRFGSWFIKNYEEIADGKTPSLEQLKQIVNR